MGAPRAPFLRMRAWQSLPDSPTRKPHDALTIIRRHNPDQLTSPSEVRAGRNGRFPAIASACAGQRAEGQLQEQSMPIDEDIAARMCAVLCASILCAAAGEKDHT